MLDQEKQKAALDRLASVRLYVTGAALRWLT